MRGTAVFCFCVLIVTRPTVVYRIFSLFSLDAQLLIDCCNAFSLQTFSQIVVHEIQLEFILLLDVFV